MQLIKQFFLLCSFVDANRQANKKTADDTKHGVNCGGHRAATCELCPMVTGVNYGRWWCNGDCQWHFENKKCESKGAAGATASAQAQSGSQTQAKKRELAANSQKDVQNQNQATNHQTTTSKSNSPIAEIRIKVPKDTEHSSMKILSQTIMLTLVRNYMVLMINNSSCPSFVEHMENIVHAASVRQKFMKNVEAWFGFSSRPFLPGIIDSVATYLR